MNITPSDSSAEGFLGAVASNAGDDFHTLWATREILRLLDAHADVTAIKVEGLPPDEIHAHVGEHGQAVDIHLTCNTKDGATNTYLQLKYSASAPEETALVFASSSIIFLRARILASTLFNATGTNLASSALS